MTRLGITSVSNARLKTIRRLRRRGADGVFLVEGYRGLLHAVESSAAVREVYVAPPLFLGGGEPRLVERAEAAGADVFELGVEAFCSIAGRVRPDGLLALVERFDVGLDDVRLPACPLLLVAEAIDRPGNLGTIVRTACGAGVDAVFVCDGSTSVFHPDTVQGSVGALFHVHVVQAGTEETIAWLRARAVPILVASPDAEHRYWEADCSGPLALVVGNERHGVSRRFRDAADAAVQIPMGAGVDSLNVAVATGILLFEAARQRSPRTTSAVSSSGETRTASARASASAAGG